MGIHYTYIWKYFTQFKLFYQFLKTGTSDRTNISRDKLLKCFLTVTLTIMEENTLKFSPIVMFRGHPAVIFI